MTFSKLMTSAAIVALLSGPALAQEAAPDTATDPGTGTSYTDPVQPAPLFTSIDEMTVGEFIGMVVYEPEGETIGEIDYVVPYEEGHAGVIGIGGFLGLGEYTVAIPLEDFELGAEGASLTLDTDKETLEQTPEFDESDAESLPDDTLIGTLIDRDDEMEDSGSANASDDAMSEDAGSDDMQTDGAATDDMATDGGATDDGMEAEDAAPEAGSDMATGEETGAAEDAAAEECPEGSTDPECAPGEEMEETGSDAN